MATYTQIIYHIVFTTKERNRVLKESEREKLFSYIWGVINNHQSHLYRINGIEDHLHIMTSIHPTVCLSDFVKEIKTGSSRWIKENGVFHSFEHWQEGYGAFTLSMREKDSLIEYIKRQKEHHKGTSFIDEYKLLLEEAGITFDERYLD